MVRQSRPSKLSQGGLAGAGLFEKVGHCRQVLVGISFSRVMGEGVNGYGSITCELM
jgi:hypothetical protein